MSSLGKEILNALGIVAGILIPGTSKSTTSLTSTLQQELANWGGQAAKDLASKLALDTTMTGPAKVFAIAQALVETAVANGIKGDEKILFAVALDVAQAAYRSIVPNIETDIVALASAFTANPLVGVAAELVGSTVQALLTKWGGPSPTSAALAA